MPAHRQDAAPAPCVARGSGLVHLEQNGVGVAMGISPYVDDDLAAGRLTAPFAQSVSKGEHWYLIYRAARQNEAAFQAFRAWIVRAASVAQQVRA